jgi:hypothetical protein
LVGADVIEKVWKERQAGGAKPAADGAARPVAKKKVVTAP